MRTRNCANCKRKGIYMKQAVFFDIDGTLWDENFQIPESTKEAIIKLQEKKIYTFINTGRTKAFVTDPELLNLKFDGIIAGCGTYVEYQSKMISQSLIQLEELKNMITFFKKNKIPAVLEGTDNMYLDEDDFIDPTYAKRMKSLLGNRLLPIKGNESNLEVHKFSCGIMNEQQKTILNTLHDKYDVLIHEMPLVAELLPKGYGKFFGIQEVCKHLEIDEKNTYAFGDSVNDLDMLSNVGHGIAMGNGSEHAKKVAEFVTSKLREDGIYNGLVHFGLIK